MPGPAQRGSTDRGTLGGELRFAGACLLLVLTLALEVAYNLASAVFFVFFRRAYRNRVRRVMFHGHGASPAASILVIALCGLLFASGCGQAQKAQPSGSPHSFGRQMRETRWTLQVLANQDPWWKPNRLASWESLGQDTLFFLDLDGPYKHGIVETVRMLGW